jgi:VWFA-related protein
VAGWVAARTAGPLGLSMVTWGLLCRPAVVSERQQLNIPPFGGSIERSEEFMTVRTLRALLPALFVFAFCSSGAGGARAQQQPAQPPQPPAPSQAPPDGYAISVTVPVVSVDVLITDNNGNYLSGLRKENFRILEDGVPQRVGNFDSGQGSFSMVMLAEYSKLGYGYFLYNARNWAYAFLRHLQPQDWVALASFDTRPHIEVDFTHNPEEISRALYEMQLPFYSESNLFDALVDTLDRMRELKGRKAILVLASGIDTFSRLNLSQVLQRLKENDVTIFCVGVAEPFFTRYAVSGNLTYLQAQNQLRTFASLSGGRAWFPRFDGEVPGIMADVAASLRNQYSLTYTPTNTASDGKYRKIKVELVAPDGTPLDVRDQKGKKVNYRIFARDGYQAPKSTVGD